MEAKPKSNAVLKTLPEERQQQIAEWCAKGNDRNEATGKPIAETGGLRFARKQLAADGLFISINTLSEFFSWWQRRQKYRTAITASEEQRELMLKFRPDDAKLAREFGEFVLLQKANELEDLEVFRTATMASDMRRRLDLDEKIARAKAAIAKVRLGQKDKDQQLAEWRFQRDSCKLFLKWFDAEAAKKIAISRMSNAEKIEQLGQAMFGEDWSNTGKIAAIRKAYFADIDALEASGDVKLPA